MKITVTSADAIVEDLKGNILSRDSVRKLEGVSLEGVELADDLDMPLADLGICGGRIRFVCREQDALDIVVDYWAPDLLSADDLSRLVDYTRIQFEDGVGEGGLRVTVGSDRFLVVAIDAHCIGWQTDDGKSIAPASTMARAARDGDIAALEVGAAGGEDINGRLVGYTGLHLAILYGRVDAVTWLLEHGANPNVIDRNGDSPLHLCASSNYLDDVASLEITRRLLQHGALAALVDRSGVTASSLAAGRKKFGMVTELKRVPQEG